MKRICLSLLVLLLACAAGRAQVVVCYADSADGYWGEAGTVVTPYVTYPTGMVGAYSQNRVTAVRLALGAAATNVYLYIKRDPHDTQPLYRQKVGNLPAGWHDIALETPFEIDGSQPLCLGYKASFDAAGGVAYSAGVNEGAGTIYYNSKNNWTSVQGSLCIHALVEGDHLPQGELRMGALPDLTAPYDSATVSLTGTLRNMGANTVDRYALAVSIDGQPAATLEQTGPLVPNATATYRLTLPADVPGSHEVAVCISEVDGQPDAWLPGDTARFALKVNDPAFRRKVVCEEFTGDWCGWCPRGLVGLEKAKQAHKGWFFPISIHGGQGDPLEIDSELPYTYKEFIDLQKGAPSCTVDRRMTGDPYWQVESLYATEAAAPSGYAVKLQAWWNADSTRVDAVATFRAETDVERPALRMAFVVTEDSVTGYQQHNYYAGGTNGEMEGWENKTDPTTDFAYMDLARGIFGGYQGMPCTDLERLPAGEPQTFSYSFELPPTVADPSRVSITALLIDSTAGYIQNADRTVPLQPETEAIGPAAVANQPQLLVEREGGRMAVNTNVAGRIEVWTTDGRRVQSLDAWPGRQLLTLPKGMYVVRLVTAGGTHRTAKASL